MPIIVCFTRANERNNFLSSLTNIKSPVGELLLKIIYKMIN